MRLAHRTASSAVTAQGARSHPELGMGAAPADADAVGPPASVGNSQVLHDTALVEAFNLKFAVEMQLQHVDAAREALADMPPRDLHELDAYTLHNRAVAIMAEQPSEGFRTLAFLIEHPPFPPEAFANLLLSYIKPPHRLYDLAADLIGEHPDYSQAYLPPDLLAFLDAINLRQDAPDEAVAQFESLARRHLEKLRLLSRVVQVCGSPRERCATAIGPCWARSRKLRVVAAAVQ